MPGKWRTSAVALILFVLVIASGYALVTSGPAYLPTSTCVDDCNTTETVTSPRRFCTLTCNSALYSYGLREAMD